MPMVGSAAPDVAQLDGLGDRLGTGLDTAGRSSPRGGLDVRNHRLPLLSVRVGGVIGSTEPAISNLC